MSQISHLTSRFGFHSLPFTRELAIEEGFTAELFAEPLRFLRDTLERRMSAALVAPAGTGKTFLLRLLAAGLPEARFRTHYLKVTALSKRDFCRELSRAVGAEPAGNYPALVRRLQDRFLETLQADDRRPVLIVDEAHDMRPEVLAILRILTNFEMDSRLVVSIVLAGQPLLAKILRLPALEDVLQRLAHFASLRPLSRKESTDYIQHRCRIAGAASCPFDPSGLEALCEIGKGNMRAMNHLALKALEIAHRDDCQVVDANHVAKARSMLCP